MLGGNLKHSRGGGRSSKMANHSCRAEMGLSNTSVICALYNTLLSFFWSSVIESELES